MTLGRFTRNSVDGHQQNPRYPIHSDPDPPRQGLSEDSALGKSLTLVGDPCRAILKTWHATAHFLFRRISESCDPCSTRGGRKQTGCHLSSATICCHSMSSTRQLSAPTSGKDLSRTAAAYPVTPRLTLLTNLALVADKVPITSSHTNT